MSPSMMPVRCSGCAFTNGTEANACVETQLLATLCVMTDEPFYCHANAVHDVIPPGEERLCLGFVEALKARGPVQPWQIAVGEEAMRIFEEARERHASGQPALSAEELDAQFWPRILTAAKQARDIEVGLGRNGATKGDVVLTNSGG